jgi:hypothetical protein
VGDGVGGIGAAGFGLGVQLRPIALEREQIVAATLKDGCGDVDLRADGADGDGRALELETLQQKGGALISFDFSAAASYPRTRRWRLAQADSICSGLTPFAADMGAP